MGDILLVLGLLTVIGLIFKPWMTPKEWRQYHGEKELTRRERKRAKERAKWLQQNRHTLSKERLAWIDENPDWLKGR